jgi:Zn-dependent protease
VLTIAFSFWISGGLLFKQDLNLIVRSIPYAFAGIVTAFFFHEMLHKIMAQKFGLWAEYRLYPLGLILSLILAVFTGFIFAAPGAVMFMGGSGNQETGRIASAGPLANILIASVSLPLYFVFFGTVLGILFGFICLINAVLATFNLLPFGPLDGVKIIRWNATIWMIMLIISIVILVTIFPQSSVIISKI